MKPRVYDMSHFTLFGVCIGYWMLGRDTLLQVEHLGSTAACWYIAVTLGGLQLLSPVIRGRGKDKHKTNS